MAKPVKTTLKLQITGGQANPSPSSLRDSLKLLGLSNSATGKLPFSRPLSQAPDLFF